MKELFDDLGLVPPFNTRNEILVMQELAELCRQKLNEYPSTLQGDLEQLEQEDLT